MTIGKKLYFGFGAILLIMLFLLAINIATVVRQYGTRSAVRDTLQDVQTIERIRYDMIGNRLSLGNYLLSGDLRDEENTNKGINDLQDILRMSETSVHDSSLRSALTEVEGNERDWADNLARPMMAKRHQVDAGNATVSDLQIFYLQRDPSSWIRKSTSALDGASQSVSKAQEESNASSATAMLFSAI